MKKIDVGQTVGILANLGVLAGIVFLAYEVRQSTFVTRLSTAESFTATLSEIELFIVGDPEFTRLLLKGIEGEALSTEDALRLELFYRSVLRVWQTGHYQYLSSALDEGLWEGQRQGYLSTLARDQGLQSNWRQNLARYTPEFNEFMERLLQEGVAE